MLQGQRELETSGASSESICFELETVAKQILSELAPLVSAQHGMFYLMDTETSTSKLNLLSSYAYKGRKSRANQFRLGEGLVGQVALEKERILLTEVPAN